MAITDWPEDDRPREKLRAKGAPALSVGRRVAGDFSAHRHQGKKRG